MYAITQIAGKQFKITENQYLFTPHINKEDGESIEFDKILLHKDKHGNIELGTPTIKGIKIIAKKIEDFRDKKIIVFKKKRRKGYKVKNGHRQTLSKVYIEKIIKE